MQDRCKIRAPCNNNNNNANYTKISTSHDKQQRLMKIRNAKMSVPPKGPQRITDWVPCFNENTTLEYSR